MGATDDTPRTITRLLLEWREGDAKALEELVPLVYDELRRLARLQMRDQAAGHTLQPTALVHEAYARLVDLKLDWQDRTHFLSMAARTMRRVLVDHARAQRAVKRGGGAVQVSLHDFHAKTELSFNLLAIDEALRALNRQEKRTASVVELYYFGGLTCEEISESLDISRATTERDLRFARSWLRRELSARKKVDDLRRMGADSTMRCPRRRFIRLPRVIGSQKRCAITLSDAEELLERFESSQRVQKRIPVKGEVEELESRTQRQRADARPPLPGCRDRRKYRRGGSDPRQTTADQRVPRVAGRCAGLSVGRSIYAAIAPCEPTKKALSG